LWFDLTVDAPRELARDADRVGALMNVAAKQSERGAARAAAAAEVIIMDRSLSMHRREKLHQAKRAVSAAIDALSEGTYFAVIAGTQVAEDVYPGGGVLQRANARTKADAKVGVSNQVATGGTAIGSWLALANQLFDDVPGAVRHAVLYADGINEHETTEELEASLRACRDRFVCDVRGVGVDWDQRELRRIADSLQGTIAAIIDIADLRADLTRLMEHAKRLLIPRACLRLKLDRRFQLESIRQVRPTPNDLTDHCLHSGSGEVDVPLLAWGEETRDYLVVLRVNPATLPLAEVRAAGVKILAGTADEDLTPCSAPVPVVVRRLPYRDRPPMPVTVTRAHDLVRLDEAVRASVAAYERDDKDAALRELADAVRITRQYGTPGHRTLLERLVTIDEYGGVHLRDDITREDLLVVGTGTTNFESVRQPSATVARPSAKPDLTRRTCPQGHVTEARVVHYCEVCGHDFRGAPDPA